MDNTSTTGHAGWPESPSEKTSDPVVSVPDAGNDAIQEGHPRELAESAHEGRGNRESPPRTKDDTPEIDPVKPYLPMTVGALILVVAAVGAWVLYGIIGPADQESVSFLIRFILFIICVGATLLALGWYIHHTLTRQNRVFYKLTPRDYRDLFIQLLPGVTLAALGNTLTPEFGWISLFLGIALSILTLRRTGPNPDVPETSAEVQPSKDQPQR